MPHIVTFRRVFAGVPVTMATAATPLPESGQPHRLVALGWISHSGGHVIVSDHMIGSVTAPAGR